MAVKLYLLLPIDLDFMCLPYMNHVSVFDARVNGVSIAV